MPVIDVTGIGAVEMEAVRPFLIKTFENHFKMAMSGKTTPNGTGTSGRNQVPTSTRMDASDSTSDRDSSIDERAGNPTASVSRSRIRRFR
jgi:hypothetical protein